MPSLGADMEAGTLVEWLKCPGDKLTRGDVVAVVETQKGAIEIEIFETGTLTKHLVQPGAKVPVGAPLAELDGAGAPAALAPAATPPPRPVQPVAIPAAPSPPPPPPSPVEGRKISPAARKLAQERGIDLTAITGSGPDGAVVFVDVERALKQPPPASEPAAAPPRAAGAPMVEMRKAIAAAMSRAKREIPHYYLCHEIDATPLQEWLSGFNAARAPANRLLAGCALIKAVAKTLKFMPDFNGHFVEGAYRPSAAVHVGMAVAVRGDGLIAPAIHHADALSLDEVMEKLRDLVARVRGGRLRGSELTDPTATISSLGERGVDALYGVIHPPQVALVGFGTPRDRPWMRDGAVTVRSIMTATLAADHRVSDGHRGALFLAKIAEHLQHPEAL